MAVTPFFKFSATRLFPACGKVQEISGEGAGKTLRRRRLLLTSPNPTWSSDAILISEA